MIANNHQNSIITFIIAFVSAYIMQAILIAVLALSIYFVLSLTMFSPIGEAMIWFLTNFVWIPAVIILASSFRVAVNIVSHR